MNKLERQKSNLTENGGLSFLGLAQIEAIFSEAEFWREGYKEAAGDVLDLLVGLGATADEAEEFYLELAAIDVDSGNHFGVLPAMTEVLGQLAHKGLSINGSIRRLLLDTMAIDQDGFLIWNDARKERVIRTAGALARVSETTPPFCSERTSLKLSEVLRRACGKIGIDSKSNQVMVRRGSLETPIPVEFFSSQRKTEYFRETRVEFVRVGELFFIDERHRRRIPNEVLEDAKGMIIFVPNIDESEFGGNLGYYTCNTLASLMTTDLSGLTILDCGSGSGILSVAALRLGAARVLGVEFDQTRVIKAHQLSIANGGADQKRLTFLKADLRDRESVITRLIKYSKGSRIGVVSNLGYWPDYPITNITNLSYIVALREAGLQPSLFIGGGYSEKESRVYRGEEELLSGIGIDWHDLPSSDVGADREILAKLGFSVTGFSISESPMRSRYHAGSLAASM